MDALKKAEEEKKQAAKRLQDVEMEAREITIEDNISDVAQVAKDESDMPELFTQTSQFSLEPLSVTDKFDETKDAALVDDSNDGRKISTENMSEAFSEDLTMENTVSESLGSAQEIFEETHNDLDFNETTIIEGLSSESASAPFDDTFHGVLFESEEQDTEVYDETLPGVPAEQLAKDLGGGEFQPTPVAAKTVFSAGRSNKRQSSFKWGAFIVLALLIASSFAVLYYFSITPVSRNLPSPLIARGVESSSIEPMIVAPPSIPSSAEPELMTGSIVSSDLEESKATLVEEIVEMSEVLNETTNNVEEVEQVELIEAVVDEVKTPELDENTVDAITSSIETENESVVEEKNETLFIDEPVSTEIEPEPKDFQESIQFNSSLINISKSKMLEKENSMVSQAFNAYQEGHYDVAKSIYTGVLKNDADNRDAHLGLAAIAVSQLDRKNAYAHYVHLLELNPADTLAMNALIGLSNSADPVKDESAIKLLIQREGDMPYLYFSLGNIYAKQKRWASAQQAFFDAYRLDTTNSNYVLNLAISLDQIGQYDTALDFYKTAMDLSQHSTTKFDPIPVRNRILALSKLIKSKL